MDSKREEKFIPKKLTILVKGKNDMLFFEAFIKYILKNQYSLNQENIQHVMKEKIVIHPIHGKCNLRKLVTLVSNDIEKIDFLVVFLDSDGNYDSTLSMIEDFYKSLIGYEGLDMKNFSWNECMINYNKNNKKLKFAFGIIQNCLEELIYDCIKSTKYGNRVLDCIQEYFSCITQNGWKFNSGCSFYKSIIYSYIAIKDDPEMRLGEASQAGYFPFQGEKIQVIKNLFENPLGEIL